jgi:DNA invertase Pin-like site-specific DNA recombinase
MTAIGYARVSTTGQDLTIQIDRLKAAGCTRIEEEKKSGKRRDDRWQLQRLLGALRRDDLLIVTKLDRIARSSRDLHNIIHEIAEAGAQFKSLDDPWCDTTTPHGRLLLSVMAGLAEFERDLIMDRTQAGIQRARELRKTFGRPAKLNSRQKIMIAERYSEGSTMRQLADDFDVSIGTIHAVLKGGAARADVAR